MVQFLEQEHYSTGSSLAELLSQPYCPPPMMYEKKVVVPVERAILTKAANVTHHNKSQTLRLVQDAIKLHADDHNERLSAKD